VGLSGLHVCALRRCSDDLSFRRSDMAANVWTRRLTYAKKHRGWFKRALGLGETTPPRPGDYWYDPTKEAVRKLKAEIKQAPKPRKTGRVFDVPGKEVTGLVDKKGRPIASKPAPVAPKLGQRSTASRRPRAEPITSHWTAGLGVGGPGGGSIPPSRREPTSE
jgi:hypothetical protein